MPYAGEYDPTPHPEPKKKPKISVVLRCGETVMTNDAYWSSDPLYGGWKTPYSIWCDKHKTTDTVRHETSPPNRVY